MAKITWIDKVIAELNHKPAGQKKATRKIIDFLQENYETLGRLRKLLSVESKHIAYHHLRQKLEDVVVAEKRHADVIHKLLRELGGQVKAEAGENEKMFAKGNFCEVLRIFSELQNRLAEQVNVAEDYGYQQTADKLNKIKNENYHLIETIERVVMCTNAEV